MKMSKMIMPVLAIFAISACSSVKKADIAATANPSEEIATLDKKVEQGYQGHFDVLAEEDFAKSRKYLAEAKEDLKDGESQKEILDDVRYATAYFDRAAAKAATRREKVPGVIDAREKAISAGARKFPPTQKDLGKLDKMIRSESDSLEKMDANEVAELQAKYLTLELDAIKNTHLGAAAGRIQGAIDKKAGDYAPKALKAAQLDYANAENLITANRNQPDSFKDAVAQANLRSEILVGVLANTRQGKLDENAATKIVMQDREINKLQGALGAADAENQQMGSALKKAGAAMSLQQSLETARKEFSPEEAEVFQQGDKLLIRLKQMNFASGRSDLPSESLMILAKVKSVAEGLGPKSVVIEGHTDSTGSAKINSKLSEERADAIAKYLGTNGLPEEKLRAVGYGFKKPIASNKSKEGRAQNRRVDVIITPEAAPANQQM